MNFLIAFVRVLALVTLSFVCFMIIFSIVEGTINYFKNKKIKKDFSNNMKDFFETKIPELLEEIEKDAKEEKEKKKAKKTTKKTRKPKEEKKED